MGPFFVLQNSNRKSISEDLVFPILGLTHFCLGSHRSEYWKLVIVHHSFTLHPITEYHRIISKYWAIKYWNICTSTILTLACHHCHGISLKKPSKYLPLIDFPVDDIGAPQIICIHHSRGWRSQSSYRQWICICWFRWGSESIAIKITHSCKH